MNTVDVSLNQTTTVYYTIINNTAQNFPKVTVVNNLSSPVANVEPILNNNTTCPALIFQLGAGASCVLGFQIIGNSMGGFVINPEVCETSVNPPIYCSDAVGNEITGIVSESVAANQIAFVASGTFNASNIPVVSTGTCPLQNNIPQLCSLRFDPNLNASSIANPFNGNTYDIILNNNHTMAYGSSSNQISGAYYIFWCSVKGIMLNTCFITPNVGNQINGVRLNADNSLLYTTSSAGVNVCVVQSDGSINLTACNLADSSAATGRVVLHPTGIVAYFVTGAANTIRRCSVNPSGTFSNCQNFTKSNIRTPLGIDGNAAGTYLYIANTNNTVTICAVNADTTLGTCGVPISDPSFQFVNYYPLNLFIDNNTNIAYFLNGGVAEIVNCGIINDGAALGSCNATNVYPSLIATPNSLAPLPISIWIVDYTLGNMNLFWSDKSLWQD